ncbi:putative caspase-like protein [Azospirillum agricola]|uniref:caspase family protein n=1 Tax=Azospirillum agricola TaxID=1720247 RepID=UPI001AE8D42D|nr:caspase family protein [Azospirillum agricola]MBP2230039.1 putative caspase-like protein [Azospirillum agricola]
MMRWTTALLVLAVLWTAPALAGKRVAMVIGNAGYGANDDLSPLPNVANDVPAMVRTLRDLGFLVIADTDVDKRRFSDRLLELKDALTLGERPEMVFVYYSGHGMEIGGRNYLIPLGARIDRKERARDEATDLQEVLADLAEARAPATIVVLDSCRNDPFGKGRGPRFKGADANAGFARIDAPEGMLIAYATKPGTTAMAGLPGETLSPFTQVFHRTLAQPGLSFQQVLAQTAAEVKRKTGNRQSPWIEGEPGLQSIVLNGRGAPPPAASAPAPTTTPVAVVRAFYAALSAADGAAAVRHVIAEKRETGPYVSATITAFYGQMSRPLRVLDIEAADPGMVLVRYDWTHRNGRSCNGQSLVDLVERSGAVLIERIRVLSGC